MGVCCTGKRVLSSKVISAYTNKISEASMECFPKHEDIQDQYVIENVIGVGSFGTVRKGYLISDREQQVAVKSINKTRFHREKDLNLFKSEIDILLSVDHPNIIKIHQAFEDSRHIHIVTEYCEGGELYHRMMSKGHYTETESREVMQSILQAVNHLHSRGISHRDLKPENFIFVSKEDNSSLKLIDFGLSKRFSSLKGRQMKTIVGTPYYIAPEILKGRRYNYKCDMWSVGTILYTLLSGHIPFPGKNSQSVYQKIRNGKYDIGQLSRERISKNAKDLLKKLLMSNPSKRISAKAALEHPWFHMSISGGLYHVDPEILRSLFSYNCKSRFRKQISFILMKYFTFQEIVTIKESLIRLDKFDEGHLTIEKLLKVVTSRLPEEVKQSFDEFKPRMDRKINYFEIFEPVLQAKIELSEDVTWNTQDDNFN